MAKKKSNDTPKWVWVLVPTLLVFFVGFLLYLSTLPSGNEWDRVKQDTKRVFDADAPAPAQPAKRKETKVAKEPAAPEKPNYDFYKLLENQKVEVTKVDAYKSTPKTQVDYQYRLQVASFRSQDEADRLRASLLLEGMEAYIQSSTVNDNTWHRVMIGPFSNRSAMNKVQDKLAARRISPMEIKEPVKK